MARQARRLIPGFPLHVMASGRAGLTIFPTDESKLAYLAWLRDAAKEYQLAVHAYVLMPNDLHLLVTPASEESLARTMQSLGRRYTQFFNQLNKFSGTIWADRYKSSIVDPNSYLLICQKFIELNPVLSDLVSRPEDYPWSSYRIHVGKEPNYGLIDVPAFWNLGNTPFERQMNWSKFVEEPLSEVELKVITNSITSGMPTGELGISSNLSSKMGNVRPSKARGRPKRVQN